jgi:hypothetical protein
MLYCVVGCSGIKFGSCVRHYFAISDVDGIFNSCYLIRLANYWARRSADSIAFLCCVMITSNSGLFASITAVFATPYFALSMVLNMVVTLLIVLRICVYRRRGQTAFGYGLSDISFNAIFIESAALYSLVSMLVVVTFSIGHPISQIWLGISPSVQVIANYLIVYRVAQGRALERHSSGGQDNSDVDLQGEKVPVSRWNT